MLKNIFQQLYKKETNNMKINKDLKNRIFKNFTLNKPEDHQVVQKQPFLNRNFAFSMAGVFAIVLVVVFWQQGASPIFNGDRIDDWQGTNTLDESIGLGSTATKSRGSTGLNTYLSPASSSPSIGLGSSSGLGLTAETGIGFSVGGAKDIENFRLNIENGFFPQLARITYEGLFYNYFFDTGRDQPCGELFCPSYQEAVTKNPLSEETEYYLSVGLNSGIKEKDFTRKKLNLVVVLDISGSMSSSFDEYYYDQWGNRVEGDTKEISNKSKMEVATQSLVDLIDHLEPEDRLGIVLFDDQAQVAKPMRLISETDVSAIKSHILEITPQGSTNMSAGMKAATELMKEFRDAPTGEYENRIIFLTDAMPNTGQYGEKDLFGIAESNAGDRIYSTFIGIGVDFQSELIEAITKIRGANYYSVHSAKEFKERMDTGFDYMVTPLVFDLQLNFDSQGFEIEEVYGSPEADKASGKLMYVNTLFPSESKEGETRGGLVLLKLKKLSDSPIAKLSVSYEDRDGKEMSGSQEISFSDHGADYYDNNGIRKGIVLVRYANLLKDWIGADRSHVDGVDSTDDWVRTPELYIPAPQLNEWEQQSVPLFVSEKYRALFEKFRIYFVSEMSAVGDKTMQQEVDVLDRLINKK